MTTLGIGIIGMGWMGQVHARSYSLVRQRFPAGGVAARLVICSDNVADRAEAARDLLGFERSAGDWQAVIADPAVDIVNIATPNHLHLPIVAAAAAAGKHIFCEKPVGRTPQETARIESLARQAGIRSFVGFNYRWAPLVMHARELIQQGAIGEIQHYRGRFFSMYGSDPLGLLSWRFDEAVSGYGALGRHHGACDRYGAVPVRRRGPPGRQCAYFHRRTTAASAGQGHALFSWRAR